MKKYENHTFVICAYKESEFLEECIKSLKNQTVKSNIIISTSTPNEYINKLASKYQLKVYINKGKIGIGEDWNFGISNTHTDYVTIAHQDDLYYPNYLEEIVKKINENKEYILLFGNYREEKNGQIIPLTKNLKIKKILQKPLIKNGEKKWAKNFSIRFGNAICCPCVTINTKLTGKNPFKTNLKCNLDWETWSEFAKSQYGFAYINKEIMSHRIHELSATSKLIIENIRVEEDYKMFKKFWPKSVAKILTFFYKEAIKTNQL